MGSADLKGAEGHAVADGEQEQPGEQVPHVGPVDRGLGQPCQPGRAKEQAGGGDRADPGPGKRGAGGPDADQDAEAERDVGHAGGDGPVAQDLLHVEGEQEEQAEERRADQDQGRGGDGAGAVGEEAERQQRLGRAQLDDGEQPKQEDAREERRGRAPVAPSVLA